jgi:hypothetical protein
MKILKFFLYLLVILALLGPDPDPDPATHFNADPSGSTNLLFALWIDNIHNFVSDLKMSENIVQRTGLKRYMKFHSEI